jgi:hypothetical protein
MKHCAAMKGNQGIVFALLDRGGDLSVANNKGQTPFEVAKNLSVKPECSWNPFETASTVEGTTTAASTENSSGAKKSTNEKQEECQLDVCRRVAVEKFQALQDAETFLSEQHSTEMATLMSEVNALQERLLRFQHFSELLQHHGDKPAATTAAASEVNALQDHLLRFQQSTTAVATTRSIRSSPAARNEKRIPSEITIMSTTSSTSDTSSLEPKTSSKPVVRASTTPSVASQRLAYF